VRGFAVFGELVFWMFVFGGMMALSLWVGGIIQTCVEVNDDTIDKLEQLKRYEKALDNCVPEFTQAEGWYLFKCDENLFELKNERYRK